MAVHDVLADGGAKPSSAGRAGAAGIYPVEALGQLQQNFARNAGTLICNLHDHAGPPIGAAVTSSRLRGIILRTPAISNCSVCVELLREVPDRLERRFRRQVRCRAECDEIRRW